ncbi:MAG: hypothetical protein GF418_03670 [Chitinivibrionales bacterium]|nr:hypothetical protein [Chitinivibrionales bacterium]MBD3394703.1 hypothetical protein [Chitinivibrionales bacterium]
MTTPRENILRTLRREGFDDVPVDFYFSPSQIEAFRKRFGHDDYKAHLGVSQRDVCGALVPSFGDGHGLFGSETLPPGTKFDEWGIGHSKGSDAAVHMTRMHHPLKGARSAEEIAAYPYPVVDGSAADRFAKAVAGHHARGFAAIGQMTCTVWERAWYLRSMEDLMMDMMTEDEKAAVLFDKVTDISCELAALYARAGVDILATGDDIGTQAGTMISVEMWEGWLKPRLAHVIAAARTVKPDVIVFYHSDGVVTPFIEGLIEIGVDVLNPIQPECMDFNEIHAAFGERLSFWGTLGTQQLLPFGSPDQVCEVVRDRIAACGEKGGLVLAPTHMVEPEVPWENISAIVDTAREYSIARYSPGETDG